MTQGGDEQDYHSKHNFEVWQLATHNFLQFSRL